MTTNNIETAVMEVFFRVFSARPEDVDDQTRRGDLERWDSLGHLDLLGALMNEFQVEIPPELALEIESVADIKRVVTTLCAKRKD